MKPLILVLFCAVAMAQPPAPIPAGMGGPAYQAAVNAWLSWLYTNKAAAGFVGGVPYTGATANVDLGLHKILASAFEAPAGTALLAGGACQTVADIGTAGDTPADGEYALFFDADNSCRLTKIDHSGAKVDLELPQDRSTAARPSCDSTTRGLWYVEKGTGGDGADVPMVCIQTSSTGPVFGWVLLNYTPA